MFRFKVGMIPTIAACSAAGLALYVAGMISRVGRSRCQCSGGGPRGMQKDTRHSPNRLVRLTLGKRKGGARVLMDSRQQMVGGMGWSGGAAVNLA
jgi:hypothetical protein